MADPLARWCRFRRRHRHVEFRQWRHGFQFWQGGCGHDGWDIGANSAVANAQLAGIGAYGTDTTSNTSTGGFGGGGDGSVDPSWWVSPPGANGPEGGRG